MIKFTGAMIQGYNTVVNPTFTMGGIATFIKSDPSLLEENSSNHLLDFIIDGRMYQHGVRNKVIWLALLSGVPARTQLIMYPAVSFFCHHQPGRGAATTVSLHHNHNQRSPAPGFGRRTSINGRSSTHTTKPRFTSTGMPYHERRRCADSVARCSVFQGEAISHPAAESVARRWFLGSWSVS